MITFNTNDLSAFIEANFVWDFPDMRKAAAEQFQEEVLKSAQGHAYERCEFVRRDLYSLNFKKMMSAADIAHTWEGFGEMEIGQSILEFSFTLSSELLFDFDVISKWTHEQYGNFRRKIQHIDSLPYHRASLFELTASAFENTPNLYQILNKNTVGLLK